VIAVSCARPAAPSKAPPAAARPSQADCALAVDRLAAERGLEPTAEEREVLLSDCLAAASPAEVECVLSKCER
jgi:hypothetical protein